MWRDLGTYTLTTNGNWLFTPTTAGTLFRLTHNTLDAGDKYLRAFLAQATLDENLTFDRRRINHSFTLDGHIYRLPDGLEIRKLAIKRLDNFPANWTIKIEELEDVSSIIFPLPISSIDGLEETLEGKADRGSVVSLELLEGVVAQLNQAINQGDTANSSALSAAVANLNSIITQGDGVNANALSQAVNQLNQAIQQGDTTNAENLISAVDQLNETIVDERLIIVSATEPDSTTRKPGLTWIIPTTGEQWIWSGTRWESRLIFFSTEHAAGTTTIWRYLPINSQYDYKIETWEYWIRSQRPHNSSEFVSPRLSIFDGIGETPIFTAPEPPLMPPQNESRNYSVSVGLDIQTTPSDRRVLGVGMVRNSNINYVSGTRLGYRLIKKP